MLTLKENIGLYKSLLANPQILGVSPKMLSYLIEYMGKFSINYSGGNYIIHSHLPPLNSYAYSRFINEHLLAKSTGPSHAQIGITNACPQNCDFCYNKKRTGTVIDTSTIKKVINDLQEMGVFWLGLTGGEPLLNKDIVSIIESASKNCAVKLFTTGYNLTENLARELKNAGLFSVSVSLDHWIPEKHDKSRNYNGAFDLALKAIDIFKTTVDMHVSVSTVLSNEMIANKQVEEFLKYLINLGVNEAWISETKPSSEAYWNEDTLISDEHRLELIQLQDKYNKEGKITVNYLGHFENRTHFGCNAGHKMVYVDSFGEVSPCVFVPMTFGNVKNQDIKTIWNNMSNSFPSESSCFINKNYKLLQKHYQGSSPIDLENSLKIINEVAFSPLSKFSSIYQKKAFL